MAPDHTGPLQAALADRYRVDREIGAGGMATVYLAEDLKHRRKVAVKVLRPELAATLGPERFIREIEIAAQLQHPHILPLLDSGNAGGFLYYVMPFVEGESLRDRLARQGELPVAEACRILGEVADALAYAHARGVVHRDIKPDNVMLSGRHALVTDFGVAKAVSEATGRQQLTTAGVALGTPAYMAPEQAAADPMIDHRADIYALGAMGYELCSGRPPFVGNSPQQVLAMHVTEPAQPVQQLRPSLPAALADAIMRCLAKRPADRWQTATELLDRIEFAATPSGGLTPTGTAPVAAVSAGRAGTGHPVRVTGLFLLASVAVLGVVYFLTLQLGLPDWVPVVALVLMGLGLPIMVVTGLIERRRARARAAGTHISGEEKPIHRWFTWRRAVLGGVLAFALLGLGTLVFTAMRLLGIGPVGTLLASGKLQARDKVLVADFTSRTADSTLGPSVSEAFRIDLSQSRVMSLLSRTQMQAGLARMDLDGDRPVDESIARELAQREGAKAYVLGDISRVGQGYVLSARLVGVADGQELAAIRETAEDDTELLSAIDRLSGRMRERIGESLKSIRAGEPLERVTTASLPALRRYTEGTRAVDEGDFTRGIELLGQAIAMDSGFAMAWRKLAVALGNSDAGYADQLEAATRAFRNRERLPEIERYQTIAYYHINVEFDPEKVLDAYQSVLRLNPDDGAALNNSALAFIQLRRYPEAETVLQRAIRNVGGATVFHINLVSTRMHQGRIAEARRALDSFDLAFPGNEVALTTRVRALASWGEYDSATSLARHLLSSREPALRMSAYTVLAHVAQARGKLRESMHYREERSAVARDRGIEGSDLETAITGALMALYYRGRPAEAIGMIERAEPDRRLSALEAVERPYNGLAELYASAGQPDRARRYLEEYRRVIPEAVRQGNAFYRLSLGYLAMAEDRPRDAIPEFRAFRDLLACNQCGYYDEGRAWEKLGEPDSAIAGYRRALAAPRGLSGYEGDSWELAFILRRLGELEEARNERASALGHYGRFVELWRDADPELQPMVREVRARMAQLAAEPRSPQ